MRLLFLFTFMFFSTVAFGQTADTMFFDQVKGKTIVGKSVEGKATTYVFSADGKSVMLKKNTGYNHTFVEMVGDVAVYKGTRGGKTHYDAFKVSGENVMLSTSDQIGGVKLKDNTPAGIAKALNAKSLTFTYKK